MRYGVSLWVPEAGGAIGRPGDEAHDLIVPVFIVPVFGSMSKGERNRLEVRVHAAMSVTVGTVVARR